MTERDLTVAVTGPTGTFGFGLIPLLQADDRIGRIVGVARRPFDPAAYGWTKMTYRRGDVRDPEVLRDAFGHADVVVHLAFLVTGTAPGEVIRSVNVDGTLNAFQAAARAGARRFVYASSVAAYGFHPDNPVGMTEEWPVRPAARLFYARQKAELESLLQAEAARAGRPALYLLRPPIVLGPHAVGAKDLLPGPLAPLGRALAGQAGGSRCRSRSWCRRFRCSSCTKRIWVRPSPGASWPPGRPGRTTSPPTGSSPPPMWPGSSAWSRCPCPRDRRNVRPGPWRPCRSCRPRRSGSRRPAIR
jgi:uncharacterized protein YbjT (DUF2867 family)